MFFSREKEITALSNLLKNPGHAALIYGKRRVGKTELIKHISTNHNLLYYECIKDTLKENVRLFVNECKRNNVYLNLSNMLQSTYLNHKLFGSVYNQDLQSIFYIYWKLIS